MKPKKRQKLCYHCEGEVDLDVIVCPYCAADLREERAQEQRPLYNPNQTAASSSLHQTMSSLYPPPYPEKEKIEEEENVYMPSASSKAESPAEEESSKSIYLPTILFTLGIQLALLGVLMLLFSHKGVIVLKWDARLWFLYIFASVPLLVFGYRALSKL